MTNKEAIKILEELPDRIVSMLMPLDIDFDYKQALALAIKALKMKEQQELQLQLPNGEVYSPQLYSGCLHCSAHDHCVDAFFSNAVNCNAYGKET